MNREKRRAFEQVAGVLNNAFEQAGPFPGQEVTPPLLADAIRQCLEICQQIGAIGNDLNGRGASRYGDGTGTGGSGSGPNGMGGVSGQAGGSPEGRSTDPGSRYGKGSDASGQDGSRTGGGGSSMAGQGAAGTRDGSEGQGFTQLPGGTTQNGSSKSGGSPQGSSQGGAVSGGSAPGGSNTGSDSAGNQASAGGAGSPNGSAQASGSPGTSAAGQASNVKSMAKARGRDWGLPEVAAVAATRPIRVELHNDRLVIVPESRTELPKEVRLGPRTQDSMDELVSEVWTHIKGWGVAGKGMYWRPTLVMEVKPGAADRYAEIKALLADSGLDIHERRPPTAAKTVPPRKTTRK